MKYILLLALLLSCSSRDHYKKFSEDCRDFLKDWQAEHELIKFQSCKKEDPSKDQPRLTATYKVSGLDAKSVEAYLIDKFGMKPLKFVCCGFNPTASDTKGIPLSYLGRGTFKDSDFREIFTIHMMSKETKRNTREDWEVLDFIVEVETYYKGI